MRLRFRSRTSVDTPWVNYSIFDALWGIAAPLSAFFLRNPSSFDPASIQDTLTYCMVAAGVTAPVFAWYRLSHTVSRFFSAVDAVNIAKASVIAVLLTAVICFLATRLDNVPRTIPLLHFIMLAGGNIAGRTVRRMRWRQRGRMKLRWEEMENILVVGVSEMSGLYIQIVEEFGAGRQQVVALIDESASLQRRFVQGYAVAGRPQNIQQVLDEYKLHGIEIHRIVIACEPTMLSPEAFAAISRVATQRQIVVEVLPERLGLTTSTNAKHGEIEIDSTATEHLLNEAFWISKRIFDFGAALGLLILALPIMLVMMPVVLIDCGLPLVFWQVRIGRYGDRITLYKFRTLKAPYDLHGGEIPDERRMSAIGRFFRYSHLDELPQLFSILVGGMSLIGPRPLLPIDLPQRTGLRLAVRPGLTGWAQVNGATMLTPREKDAMDEWYVRHASWSLELQILLMTFGTVFFGARRNEAAIEAALLEKQAMESERCLP